MSKEGLENSTLTEQIEGKRDRRNQHIIYSATFSKWIADQGLRKITK